MIGVPFLAFVSGLWRLIWPLGTFMSDLLTVKELAAKLRVSPWRIYQAVREGKIPDHRFKDRGKILFDLAEVGATLRHSAVKNRVPRCHPVT